MKVKLGGTVSYTVMPKDYQPVTAKTTFEIEEDVSAEEVDDFINEMNPKVEQRIKEDLNSKMKTALKEQKRFRDNLRQYL